MVPLPTYVMTIIVSHIYFLSYQSSDSCVFRANTGAMRLRMRVQKAAYIRFLDARLYRAKFGEGVIGLR